jgi:hypothetical protein
VVLGPRLRSADLVGEVKSASSGLADSPVIVRCAAGDLAATFRSSPAGLELESLQDARTQASLATGGTPLFSLLVRHVSTKEERTLTAAEGWRGASLQPSPNQLRFR